jgi:hypothetical protein
MICRICGAVGRCKKAAGEICCSCHPHKVNKQIAEHADARREWERVSIYYTKQEAEQRIAMRDA